MKKTIGCFMWLLSSLHAGAEPLVEGRVRLASGGPAAGAQVLLFDLTDLRLAPVAATTDEAGVLRAAFRRVAVMGGGFSGAVRVGAELSQSI